MLVPDDPGYDHARMPYYGGVDRHPAVIIRPTGAAAVARIVLQARDSGLELAVRSGGHSSAWHSVNNGGIVLDLGAMTALDIDVEGRTAWAQTGLTAIQDTTATHAHRLATGLGDTGSMGIGGLTLSGGVGYLVRKHGLTIDDLLAAELVTADGRVLQMADVPPAGRAVAADRVGETSPPSSPSSAACRHMALLDLLWTAQAHRASRTP